MIAELYSLKVHYRCLEDNEDYNIYNQGHGGRDVVIMKELFEVMVNGGEPKCSGSEGLESAVFVLALDEAMRKNKVVELESIWKKLGK